jgi:hypothetical protein
MPRVGTLVRKDVDLGAVSNDESGSELVRNEVSGRIVVGFDRELTKVICKNSRKIRD